MSDDATPRMVWPIAIVVLCLIAAGLFGWALQPGKPHLPAESSYQALAESYKAQHPECQLDVLRRLPQGQRELRAASCADGTELRRQANAGLVQARRQADAANAGVILAAQQTRIAAWGVVISSLTLFAALGAAWYAKQAAEAARNALAHDENLASIQLRPNVLIETVDADIVDGTIRDVTFTVRNSGTVPARNFKATGGWGFREEGVPVQLDLAYIKVPRQITFGNSYTVSVPPSADSSASNESVLYCEFEIYWTDRAGEQHHIHELHQHNGEDFRFIDDL